MRHWGADEGTNLVLAYLEDVADGRAFVEAARSVSDATPVVALKAGRTEAGLQAAASHTGALVSDDVGFDAASMLDGPRGGDPVDVDALADALVRLSRLATECPIRELEVNPLLATPDGVLALDVHGRLEDEP